MATRRKSPQKPESFAAGVGRGLRRAGTPIYVWAVVAAEHQIRHFVCYKLRFETNVRYRLNALHNQSRNPPALSVTLASLVAAAMLAGLGALTRAAGIARDLRCAPT